MNFRPTHFQTIIPIFISLSLIVLVLGACSLASQTGAPASSASSPGEPAATDFLEATLVIPEFGPQFQAPALPSSQYVPLSPPTCSELQNLLANSLSSTFSLIEAPFATFEGQQGMGCQMQTMLSGASFAGLGALQERVIQIFAERGWFLEPDFAADSDFSLLWALRQDIQVCLVNVNLAPAEGVYCGDEDLLHCMERLPAEQKNYTLSVTCAANSQRWANAYAPLAQAACKILQSKVQAAIKIESTGLNNVYYVDRLNRRIGTACQVGYFGDGNSARSLADLDERIARVFSESDWIEDPRYERSSPTSTGSAYHKDSDRCLITIEWEPASNADCPGDQPITSCNLPADQQFYTVKLDCITDPQVVQP